MYKLIAFFAALFACWTFVAHSKHQIEYLQMTRFLSLYTKQSTMLKNKLHGETVLGTPSKLVISSLKAKFETFAVAKSGLIYDDSYRSTLVKN